MTSALPELSSISAALDELINRISEISGRVVDVRQNDMSMELVEIERQLQWAQRRLHKLTAKPAAE